MLKMMAENKLKKIKIIMLHKLVDGSGLEAMMILWHIVGLDDGPNSHKKPSDREEQNDHNKYSNNNDHNNETSDSKLDESVLEIRFLGVKKPCQKIITNNNTNNNDTCDLLNDSDSDLVPEIPDIKYKGMTNEDSNKKVKHNKHTFTMQEHSDSNDSDWQGIILAHKFHKIPANFYPRIFLIIVIIILC